MSDEFSLPPSAAGPDYPGREAELPLCQLSEVSLSFADRDVFDRIDLVVGARDRIAVVGDNGAGKSTLLRMIAGTLHPDSGERRAKIPGGIAYAMQNPVFPPRTTVAEVIDSYHQRVREVEYLRQVITDKMARAAVGEQPRLLSQLQQVEDLFEAMDGYSLDRRLDSALQQLGLGQLDRNTEVSSLSGGQRNRLCLAAVLCASAQLVLLDEPTNDLDEAGLAWLDRAVQSHRGAMIAVSHDRMFLRSYARKILQVHEAKIQTYSNGYEGYLAAKRHEREARIQAYEHWAQEVERATALVQKNAGRAAAIPRKQEKAGFGHGNFRMRSRSHGSTSKIRQAKARLQDLQDAPLTPLNDLEFSIPATGGSEIDPRERLITIQSVLRRDAPGLSVDSWTLRAGQRWLVSGVNGAGKTTFLRVCSGELPVDQGIVHHREVLKINWLRQQVRQLSGNSVIEAFARAADVYPEHAVDLLRATGLWNPEDLVRHPATLSVGQQRRLELAVAVSTPADVLILDEPTNHLSPDLVEQLEQAIAHYPGAVIVVSHDRWLRRSLRGSADIKRLHLEAGSARRLE